MPVTRTQLAAQSAGGVGSSRQHHSVADPEPSSSTLSSSASSSSSSSRSSGRATRARAQRQVQQQQQQQVQVQQQKTQQVTSHHQQQQRSQPPRNDGSLSPSSAAELSPGPATLLPSATGVTSASLADSSPSGLDLQANQKGPNSHAKDPIGLLPSNDAGQDSLSHHHHHHGHQGASSSSHQQPPNSFAHFSSAGLLDFSPDGFGAAAAAAASAANASTSSQNDSQLGLESFKASDLGPNDIQSHPAWSGFMTDIYLHGHSHFGGASQSHHVPTQSPSASQLSPSHVNDFHSLDGSSSQQRTASSSAAHMAQHREGHYIQGVHTMQHASNALPGAAQGTRAQMLSASEGVDMSRDSSSGNDNDTQRRVAMNEAHQGICTPQHSDNRPLSGSQPSPMGHGEGALGLANAHCSSNSGDGGVNGGTGKADFNAQWNMNRPRQQQQQQQQQPQKQETQSAPMALDRYPQAPTTELSPTPLYRPGLNMSHSSGDGSPGASGPMVVRGNEQSMRAFHRQARSLGQVGATMTTSSNGLLHLGGPLTSINSSLSDRFGMMDNVSSSKGDSQSSAQLQHESPSQHHQGALAAQGDFSPDISMTARSMSPSDSSIASTAPSNVFARSRHSLRSPRTSDSTTNRTIGDSSFDTSIDSATSSALAATTTSNSTSVSRASSTSDELTSQSMSWTSSSQLTSASQHKRTSSSVSSRSAATKSVRGKSRLRNIDRKRICQYAMEHPELKQEELAKHFGIERSTVSKTLKNKESWMTIPEEGSGALIVKHRTGKFPEIESELAAWAIEETKRGNILLDYTIKNRALEIARLNGLGIGEFKASVGWIDKFRDRNKIPKTVADLNNMSSHFENLPHLMPHARTDSRSGDLAAMQSQQQQQQQQQQHRQDLERGGFALDDMTSMVLRQDSLQQPHGQTTAMQTTMGSEASDEVHQMPIFSSSPGVSRSRPGSKGAMSRTRSTSDIVHNHSRAMSDASSHEASSHSQATPKASKRHYDSILGGQQQQQQHQDHQMQQPQHPMTTPAFRNASDKLQAVLEQSPGLRQLIQDPSASSIAASSSAPHGWIDGNEDNPDSSFSTSKRRRGDGKSSELQGAAIRRTRSEEQNHAHHDSLTSSSVDPNVAAAAMAAAHEVRRSDVRRSQRTLRASPRQGPAREQGVSDPPSMLVDSTAEMRQNSPLSRPAPSFHSSPRRSGYGGGAMSGIFGRHRERTSSSSNAASPGAHAQGGDDGCAEERVISLDEARDSLDCVLSFLASSDAVLSPSDYFMLGNLQGMLNSLANDRGSNSNSNINRARLEQMVTGSLSSIDRRADFQRSP
ncbi:hypothetical protein FA10DRAFT_285006 [Acaromyces ingoldii]|uniref:HTH CENPB-type domain-containing protein n=1 Tax=Acaromyces ingoldii TaxID=215250 RepID=A0A316YTW9_9BASI|nr:hypothetical protein FA10DRAFT_285006 [Acaromyces ingoldii]PWN92108.1 hypothetical protein FA10DRAFT_285006 [Acaromyces ingoldii]